jgi:flagellar biosynthesis protein FlhB
LVSSVSAVLAHRSAAAEPPACQKLKMTREEMKKELKQSEGDPQLKQQRRQKASKLRAVR